MNIGKPKRKWKIYKVTKDDAGAYEALLGFLFECEDYMMFSSKIDTISLVVSAEEIESRNLKDACRIILDQIKFHYKELPSDIFSMAQPEVIF